VSSAGVEVVRAGFEAFHEGGPEALIEFLAPGFEFTTPANLASEPDTYRGPEGLRRYFDSFYEAMDEIGLEPRSFQEVSGRVVTEFTLRARGRTTGIETSLEAVIVWRVGNGQVQGLELFQTLEEALSAARAAG
jgi:ketosteroid isomerase-like protein